MNGSSLKIIFRSLWRNKAFSAINILGLSLGICCCIIVYVVARYELSFDSHHSKAARTYRVTQHIETTDGIRYKGVTPYPMAEAIRKDLSGIADATATHYYRDEFFEINEQQFEEKGILFVELDYFRIFDHQWLHGSPGESLTAPNTVVLTRSLQQKYFPEGPAIGKTIRMGHTTELKVTGIVQDPPNNTNLPFSMLVSYATFQQMERENVRNWAYSAAGTTFLSLKEDIPAERIEQQLVSLKHKYLEQEAAQKVTFHLQPLAEVHTNSLYGNGLHYTAPVELIGALLMLGFLIMLIVCINFINLATAHSLKSAKETAVRKILGAGRSQLVFRFLLETATLTAIALVLGLILSWLFLPYFNNYLSIIGLNLSLDLSVLYFSVLLIVLVTLLAGLLPALLVSKYNLSDSLKNKVSAERKGTVSMRKALIITQFVFSQVFLVGTIIIHKQVSFLRNKDLGFAKEDVLIVDLPDRPGEASPLNKSNLDLLRARLLQSPHFTGIAYCSTPPNRTRFHTSLQMQGTTDQHEAQLNYVDRHFLETFQVKLLSGRNLRHRADSAVVQQLLVNEALVSRLRVPSNEEMIGRRLLLSDGTTGEVVGVVQDFHNNSLHDPIEPLVMLHKAADFRQIAIRLASVAGNEHAIADRADMLEALKSSWHEVYPQDMMSYRFFDELVAVDYVAEDILYQASKIFSVMAIFIGCLGLYGLVSYMVIRRSREVAIRKVLGASQKGIFFLLSKEFIILIVIAFVIAMPISLWLMRSWLQGFTYSVSIDALSFLLAFAATLAVAYLTLSYESIRACRIDPAKLLKAE